MAREGAVSELGQMNEADVTTKLKTDPRKERVPVFRETLTDDEAAAVLREVSVDDSLVATCLKVSGTPSHCPKRY
jgi:ribosomal protein S19E (S16A)